MSQTCTCNTCGRTEHNQLIVWNKCEQCQRIEYLESLNKKHSDAYMALGDMKRAELAAQAATIAQLREVATAARDARIALTFYREWMLTHGKGETRYPFGVDAERTLATALAALEQETK